MAECRRYHILKSQEGGPHRGMMMHRLRGAGLRVAAATSCFVGHTAIDVTANKRQHDRARRIVFGKG
jgi:hypothetical protein